MKDRKIEILDELEDIAPLLLQIKRDKLQLQENYFEEMQNEVFKKIGEKRDKYNTSNKRWYSIAGIAASGLIAIALYIYYPSYQEEKYWANTDVESMIDYLYDNVDAYDDVSIYLLFNDGSIDQNELNKNELYQYIEDNLDNIEDEFLDDIL